MSIKYIQSEILTMRIAGAKSIKKQQKRNDKKKYEILQEIELKNKFKKERIKHNEAIGEKKLKAYQTHRIELSKINHATKMMKEQKRIRRKEAELAKMEILENKLIEKLKSTEKVQEHTLKELEAVIKNNNTAQSKINPSNSTSKSVNKFPKAT